MLAFALLLAGAVSALLIAVVGVWVSLGAAAIAAVVLLVCYVLAFAHDITHRAQAERACWRLAATVEQSEDAILAKDSDSELECLRRELETVNSRLHAVLEHSPTAIYMRDLDGRFTLVSKCTAEILGTTAEQLVGQKLDEVMPTQLARQMEAEDHEVIQVGQAMQFEQLMPDARDPKHRHSYLSVKFPVRDSAGETLGVGGIALDISDRVAIEQALREAEERLRTTVGQAPIGMALVDLRSKRTGRLLSANESLCRLLGHSSESLMRTNLTSLVHPEDSEQVLRDLMLMASDQHARTELELRCLHSDGHFVWVSISGGSVPDTNGAPRFAVVHVMDIGERKRFEGQLQYLADHDSLTGLFNRRRFEEELERAVAQVARYGNRAAVLMIDLDGFTHVNDTLGHSHGDEVITGIGAVISAELRDTDVIARVGGDEFAVILLEADAAGAEAACEKLLQALQENVSVLSASHHASVTASIGVSAFEADTGLTAGELLVEADIALYEAKAKGKNQAYVYVREQDRGQILPIRQSWLERLQNAVEEDRFELVAQPVLGICGNGVPRYELLLRMRGDDGELVPPGTFLYIAERFDLIQQIDRWVFSEAVRLLAVHQAAGNDISLSINMSGKTLVDPLVLADITEILAATPIRRDRLIVEVTETAAIVNIEKARTVARGLRELGCRFALDDFGAGFATFYYLKHLDFDLLKIDGEFIKSLTENVTDQLVVRSVVEIARGLDAMTVAEFIGDDDTVSMLRKLGVDYGQGYHLGRPDALEKVLPPLPRGAAVGASRASRVPSST